MFRNLTYLYRKTESLIKEYPFTFLQVIISYGLICGFFGYFALTPDESLSGLLSFVVPFISGYALGMFPIMFLFLILYFINECYLVVNKNDKE